MPSNHINITGFAYFSKLIKYMWKEYILSKQLFASVFVLLLTETQYKSVGYEENSL